MSGPEFEAYTIDLKALDRVVGSRNSDVLAKIVRQDDPPILREAMMEIVVRGRRPFAGDDYSLSRVAMRLCRVVGVRINGNTGDVLDNATVDRAQEIVAPLGLDVTPHLLVAAGELPIAGLPLVPEMVFSVVEAARVRRAYALWADVMPSDDEDDRVDEFLAEMLDWLEVASARGESLVTAYW